MKRLRYVSLLCLAAVGCTPPCPETPVQPQVEPQVAETAEAFIERFNEEGERVGLESGKAAWVQQTFITEDTSWLAAKARELGQVMLGCG